MGVAAAELATGFGWARMAAQYIALYRQIAGLRENRSSSANDADVIAANVLAGRQGADGA
jgi:hypothetical protein